MQLERRLEANGCMRVGPPHTEAGRSCARCMLDLLVPGSKQGLMTCSDETGGEFALFPPQMLDINNHR